MVIAGSMFLIRELPALIVIMAIGCVFLSRLFARTPSERLLLLVAAGFGLLLGPFALLLIVSNVETDRLPAVDSFSALVASAIWGAMLVVTSLTVSRRLWRSRNK